MEATRVQMPRRSFLQTVGKAVAGAVGCEAVRIAAGTAVTVGVVGTGLAYAAKRPALYATVCAMIIGDSWVYNKSGSQILVRITSIEALQVRDTAMAQNIKVGQDFWLDVSRQVGVYVRSNWLYGQLVTLKLSSVASFIGPVAVDMDNTDLNLDEIIF